MATWWSSGKRMTIEVETMNQFHARQALAKLERGDYFGEGGDAPTPDESEALRNALTRVIRTNEQMVSDGDISSE